MSATYFQIVQIKIIEKQIAKNKTNIVECYCVEIWEKRILCTSLATFLKLWNYAKIKKKLELCY